MREACSAAVACKVSAAGVLVTLGRCFIGQILVKLNNSVSESEVDPRSRQPVLHYLIASINIVQAATPNCTGPNQLGCTVKTDSEKAEGHVQAHLNR